MRILAIFSGEYGERHITNLKENGPDHWSIISWQSANSYPPVIDYPEDYLPTSFTEAELILSFAEHRGVAELLPDIAKLSGAAAVIAAIDNESWLPRGLARQLREWLQKMEVICATPKPLCSLTEKDYGVVIRNTRISYESKQISEFATYFGKPDLDLSIDPETRKIISVEVKRDAVCGCARYVGENLIGVSVDQAEEKAGLLHHHFPCLASMGKDIDFGDTLMHVSGNVIKDNVLEQVKPFRSDNYISPGKRIK